MMNANQPSRESGIALLMTLAFVTMAISLALETNRQSRAAIEGTRAVRTRLTAEQMATAGVHAAMAILIEDRYKSETDHLKEVWADPEKLDEALADVAFDSGRLEIRITDEMARLQVNALVNWPQSRDFQPQQRQIIERLVEQLMRKFDLQSDLGAQDIVNALKDWLDSGDDNAITGLNGAESDYYQSLDTPYKARNGPMAHIGELARVRGVVPELFNGRDDDDGLKDLMTVYGAMPAANGKFTFNGKINLNTAPQMVLAALMPSMAGDLAEAFIQYREAAKATVLASPSWYRGAPGAAGLESHTDRIGLATNIFRIRSAAERDGFSQTVSAVVERYQATDGTGWTCRILTWEVH